MSDRQQTEVVSPPVDETGGAATALVTRTCPKCGQERAGSAFRSNHPRTHCDECHAAREAGDEEGDEEASDDEARPARRARATRCPVLDLELAGECAPTLWGGVWMSPRAAAALASGLDADELELASIWLRERQEAQERQGG